ncbi:hypothetical protein L7F22_067452 [Adiantum nelumboides]|nr:hypothetical protein [Adiantum nelumboides]
MHPQVGTRVREIAEYVGQKYHWVSKENADLRDEKNADLRDEKNADLMELFGGGLDQSLLQLGDSDQSLVEEIVAPEMEIGGPSTIHPVVEEHLLDLPLPPSDLPPTWLPLDFFLSGMRVMDHGVMDTAILMSRIVQLERERDELRCNSEQAFTLQGGILSGLDLVSRIHGRRSTDLGQELEACERKLQASQKENAKLQEELSEVYSIKSKFAEQLKSEVEKSAGLEKEVKYFQKEVAAALSDRDRSVVEVERLQRKRDGLIEKVTDLQDRLDHVTSEYCEEKGLCEVLYVKLEKLKEENELHKKVTEKFWKVQERATKTFGVEEIHDKADLLLQESEVLWHYGEAELISQSEANQIQVQEELAICQASLANLQIEFETEFSARKQAEVKLLRCKKHLFYLTELIGKELQELNLLKGSLQKEVVSFFCEEKSWILCLQEFLHLVTDVEQRETKKPAGFNNLNKTDNIMQVDPEEIIIPSARSSCSTSEVTSTNDILEGEGKFPESTRIEGVGAALNDKEAAESFGAMEADQEALVKPFLKGKPESREAVNKKHLLCSSDDSKALAQALQEKVAALLLLSQQEERHILESNTTFALESQVASLKQQLLQVTSEKMDALLKLAYAQENCRKLQEQEKTFKKLIHDQMQTRGPLRFDAESTNGNENVTFTSSKTALMQSYLKHLWSKGQGLSSHISLSHMLSLRRSKGDDGMTDARLQHKQIHRRGSSSHLH